MRLLDSETLTFREFLGDCPPYAILSHTWGDDEVLYEDMILGQARFKQGFQKIKYCAEQAIRDGLQFIWVDTCNILKTSSAELSEAINSMFQWYKNAAVCYIYLSDVGEADIEHIGDEDSAFRRSRWFTRGWTLQELIAPRKANFYSSHWSFIDHRDTISMLDLLQKVTGIEAKYLQGAELQEASIARRMSWASTRVTSRPEDTAYCLMGIFDINMPLIYGEGSKAFLRLQEEIIKHSDDESIFVWALPGTSKCTRWTDLTAWTDSHSSESSVDTGLLAISPACFIPSVIDDMQMEHSVAVEFKDHYAMTNKGLLIELTVITWEPLNDVYLAVLDVGGEYARPGIFIRCLSSTQRVYARIRSSEIIRCTSTSMLPNSVPQRESIYLASRASRASHAAPPLSCRFEWLNSQLDLSCTGRWYDRGTGLVPLPNLKRRHASLTPGTGIMLEFVGVYPRVCHIVYVRYTKSGRCIFKLQSKDAKSATHSRAMYYADELQRVNWQVVNHQRGITENKFMGKPFFYYIHSLSISVTRDHSTRHTVFELDLEPRESNYYVI